MAANTNSTIDAMNVLRDACVQRKYQSFKDLPPGEYVIIKFSIVNSTYGDRVRIDLHDTYMFLPARFVISMTAEVINELNKAPQLMIFSGKDTNNRDRLILDFKDVAYIDSSMYSAFTEEYLK